MSQQVNHGVSYYEVLVPERDIKAAVGKLSAIYGTDYHPDDIYQALEHWLYDSVEVLISDPTSHLLDHYNWFNEQAYERKLHELDQERRVEGRI